MKKEKSVSIAEVANACNVSIMTVSRALHKNNSVKKSTRDKILAAAEELGYIRSGRMGRPAHYNKEPSRKIEIVIGGLHKDIGAFYTRLITAIESLLSSKQYDCVIKNYYGEYEQLLSLQANLRISTADATIFVGYFPPEHLKSLFDLVPNAILLDNPGDPIIETPYASFCFDNIEAGRLGVRHLLSIQRKKILLVNGYAYHFFSKEIETGYRDALRAQNIPVNDNFILNTDFTSEGAYHAVSSALADKLKFDAVFTTDEMASGVYRAIFENGLKIPEDIAVCGCDGIPVGEHLFPKLTTLILDYKELAAKSLNYLLQEKDNNTNPYRVRLLPRLKIRESTSINEK